MASSAHGGSCVCSLWAGQGLGQGGFGMSFAIRENALWNGVLVQTIFCHFSLPWQKKPSIMWEKAVSSKVGFGVWLPTPPWQEKARKNVLRGRQSLKRGFLLVEKEENRQRGEERCKSAEFGRKGDFPIRQNCRESSRRLQRLGSGCHIEKIRRGSGTRSSNGVRRCGTAEV